MIDDKLIEMFIQIFELNENIDVTKIKMMETDQWDSMAQLILVTAIQQEFGIAISAEELEGLTSYSVIRSYLHKKLS